MDSTRFHPACCSGAMRISTGHHAMRISGFTRRLLLMGVAGLMCATPIQASETIARASSVAMLHQEQENEQAKKERSAAGAASVLPNGASCPSVDPAARPSPFGIPKGGDGSPLAMAGTGWTLGTGSGCRPTPVHVNWPFALAASRQGIAFGHRHTAFATNSLHAENVIGP